MDIWEKHALNTYNPCAIGLSIGHMAGIGSHKELMKSCEVYRQIAMSQLSEEELA